MCVYLVCTHTFVVVVVQRNKVSVQKKQTKSVWEQHSANSLMWYLYFCICSAMYRTCVRCTAEVGERSVQMIWIDRCQPEERSCSVVQCHSSRYFCIYYQTAAEWTGCAWGEYCPSVLSPLLLILGRGVAMMLIQSLQILGRTHTMPVCDVAIQIAFFCSCVKFRQLKLLGS